MLYMQSHNKSYIVYIHIQDSTLNFQEEYIMKEKVVLAYSGGLDTTALIPWLKETFDYEVICCCVRLRTGRRTGWS